MLCVMFRPRAGTSVVYLLHYTDLLAEGAGYVTNLVLNFTVPGEALRQKA